MENHREQQPMSEHEFTLVLQCPADIDETLIDRIYGKCSDCTVSSRYGTVYVEFCREGRDLAKAILSAIRDVHSLGLVVRRVDVCSLVTQAEIARRAGLSRQVIHNYVTGQRRASPSEGEAFPSAACSISDEEAPLWNWCEVAAWLHRHDLIKESALSDAFVIDAVNNRLDHDFLWRLDPKRAKSLSKGLNELLDECECCQ